MEIMEAIAVTRRSVEEADLPAPWGDIAFQEVLRTLLAERGGVDESAHQGQSPAASGLPPVIASSKPGFGRLASRFGVSEDAIADVFAVDDDSISLHVSSSRIATARSRATKEIGLLIVAARQGAGLDDTWTDVAYVRDALSQYSRYDMSNFSKYLRDTGDLFNLRGKPASQLRLTRQGWEAATDLVRTMTGSAA